MTSDRTRTGNAVAAGGAVLLLISLFIAWFSELGCGEDSCSAFKTFSVVDITLLLLAIAGIALAAAGIATGARKTGPALAAIGLIASAMVFAFLVEFGDDLSTRIGIYLALVGSLALVAGGAVAAMAAAGGAPQPGATAGHPPGAPAQLGGPPSGSPPGGGVPAPGPGAQAPAGGGQPPAGWYPDPGGGGGQRYWDGSSWTEHRA